MTYLLDTEVWLWMQAQPQRFGHHTLSLLADERNQLLLFLLGSFDVRPQIRCLEMFLGVSGCTDTELPRVWVRQVLEIPAFVHCGDLADEIARVIVVCSAVVQRFPAPRRVTPDREDDLGSAAGAWQSVGHVLLVGTGAGQGACVLTV